MLRGFFDGYKYKACFVRNTSSSLDDHDNKMVEFVQEYLLMIKDALYNALKIAKEKDE